MLTVLGELRCGLTTSVYFGMGWRELFWRCVWQLCRVLWRMRSPVAVLKLGSCADQPLALLGTRKTGFRNMCFQNEPLHKMLLSANQTLALSLIYPVHNILFIPPPWVWLDLLSTFVLTPFLIFIEEDPDFVPEDVE